MVLVAENGLPAGRQIGLVLGHIPVPNAFAAAFQGELPALFRLCQGVLQGHGFADVLQGAHQSFRLALGIPFHPAAEADVPLNAARQLQPAGEVEAAAGFPGAHEGFIHPGAVIRVDHGEKGIVRRSLAEGAVAEDGVDLLGPPHLVQGDVPLPAAQAGHPLGIDKVAALPRQLPLQTVPAAQVVGEETPGEQHQQGEQQALLHVVPLLGGDARIPLRRRGGNQHQQGVLFQPAVGNHTLDTIKGGTTGEDALHGVLEGGELLVRQLLAQQFVQIPGAAQHPAGGGIKGEQAIIAQVQMLDEGGELQGLHDEGDDTGELALVVEDGAGKQDARSAAEGLRQGAVDAHAVFAAVGEMDEVVLLGEGDGLARQLGNVRCRHPAVAVEQQHPGAQFLQGALAQQPDGAGDILAVFDELAPQQLQGVVQVLQLTAQVFRRQIGENPALALVALHLDVGQLLVAGDENAPDDEQGTDAEGRQAPVPAA